MLRTFYLTIRSVSTLKMINANQHTFTTANKLKKPKLRELLSPARLKLNRLDIQVLGSKYSGFQPAVLVNSEKYGYLFNCPESTQRYCYTHGVKLNQVNNVFITNCEWEKMSGLSGLSLTIYGAVEKGLNVHSTGPLKDLFNRTNPFMIQFSMKQNPLAAITDTSNFEDPGMELEKIPIKSRGLGAPSPPGSTSEQTKSKPTGLMAFHCRFPTQTGAINPEKCKELGVPVGPLLAILKSGQDVTLRDGSIVRSQDVCGTSNIGPTFLVVDCPNESYMQPFFENERLKEIREYRASFGEDKKPDLVIHFTPEHIIKKTEYQNWLNGFADDSKHMLVMCPPDNSLLPLKSVYQHNYLLNKLDGEIFPRLYSSEGLVDKIFPKSQQETLPTVSFRDGIFFKVAQYEDLDRFVRLGSMERIDFRPNRSVELVCQASIDDEFRELSEDGTFSELLNEYRVSVKDLPKAKDYEPEIVLLGTGSAIPSKRRNVSGILVNFDHNNFSVILDCGEDTYGQIFRHFGEVGTERVFKQLKLIYVSHIHCDHQTGLLQLIRMKRKFSDEPVALVLPPGIEPFLMQYFKNFENLEEWVKVFPSIKMKTPSKGTSASKIESEVREEMLTDFTGGFLSEFKVTNVDHCPNACAVNMKFNVGHPDLRTFSISYSGDCRPSKEFATLGHGCDILIHEATFDDFNQDHAIYKKHSTTREAIEVSKLMAAKYTILTHFSQRFSKIPALTDDFDSTINFGFDHLTLRYPSQMERLPKMKSLLKYTFKDEEEKYSMIQFRKKLRKESINESLMEL